MKFKHLIVCLPLLGLMMGSSAEAWPTAKQVVEKAFHASKLPGSEMISTLTIINAKGQKRVRKTAAISKLYDGGKTEKRLIRFLSPADVKGTGLLSYDYEKKDDDIWFYLPSLRKTRRIVSTEKAKNFMGSEFTYADINQPAVDDFTYKMLRQEKADGVDCYVIESTPKNTKVAKENGFSRRVAWFAVKDNMIRKARIFDLKGKLLKVLSATDVRLIDKKNNRYRAHSMKMVNKQNGRSSTMTVNKLKLRAKIPDKYFTSRYLER